VYCIVTLQQTLQGTFEPEQKTDNIVYGLTHQLRSWNPVYIQVWSSTSLRYFSFC